MNTVYKTIYLVRHAESTANASGIRQGSDSELSELGKQQASVASKRLSRLTLDRLIASPYLRAERTMAEIREMHPDVPLEYSELFTERRNPSVMLGRSMGDPKIEAIWDEIKANYHIDGWRHSDEENFEDFRDRVACSLELLVKTEGENILVVTHGMYLKMLFAIVLLGDHLTPRVFWDRFVQIKNVLNTGIVIIELAERYGGGGRFWKLVTWNDHSHFSDDEVLLNRKRRTSPHG
jgi:broad specificity phosphatase PhoE